MRHGVMLAAVCQRAGVSRSTAHKALLEALRQGAQIGQTMWAVEVEVEGRRYVVGQGRDPRLFLVFPLPFKGHADEWKVVPPFNSVEEFLELL